MSNDDTSSFIPQPSVRASNEFTEMTEMPTKGFNTLTRAKRYGRWWVLKGLKPEYREQTAYRLLLTKEYDLMAQLSHLNIVTVNSIEEVNGLGMCIVMEWIDGINLAQWLDKGGNSRRQRLNIAQQLTEALAYIHGKQIVHRDLKPKNIMITANGGAVKLIDFGLGDADNYAIFKQSAGSDGYLSPEQRSTNKPDIRNDIYSLGCILRDLRLGIMSRLVIRRCLLPISQRYSNATQVAKALQRANRTPLVAAGLCAVMLTAGGLLLQHNSDIKQADTATQHVVTTQDTAKTPATAHKDTSKDATVSLTSRHDSLQNKQLAAAFSLSESDRQTIEQAIVSGKKLIDKRMASYDKEIKLIADTLSSQRYIEQYLNKVINSTNAFVSEYADSFKPKLNHKHAEQEINGQLLLYVSNKYYTPWINLLKDLPPFSS